MRESTHCGTILSIAIVSLLLGRLTWAQQQHSNISNEGYGGACTVVDQWDPARQLKSVYRVGVQERQGSEQAYKSFNKTFADYLTLTAGQRFNPPIVFEMKPQDYNTLLSDAENSVVDFVYSDPSSFLCVDSEFTANSLVSKISSDKVGNQSYDFTKFGGLIAARADRDDINSIYDLKDKIVAAVSFSRLVSGQAQFLEMQHAGMSFLNDPKQLVLTSNRAKVLKGVYDGKFDVGFFRTGSFDGIDQVLGYKLNKSDFKIIAPRTNFIDGVPYPFESSTPLYSGWNLASLASVPEVVSREVQNALLAMKDHAKVGRGIQTCNATHNETYCKSEVSFPYGFVSDVARCDTSMEVALMTVEALDAGAYAGWQTTLSFLQLRSMQENIGFITEDKGTHTWKCHRSGGISDAMCPAGFVAKDRATIEQGCAAIGLDCEEGFECFCSPCTKIFVCYSGVDLNGKCVAYRIFLPSLLVPLFLLIMVGVHFYIVKKRRLMDSLWEIKAAELKLYDAEVVIGKGTFGVVQLAEFRGTQVAVKRIISTEKTSFRSNRGLRSVAPGLGLPSKAPSIFNRKNLSGTGSHVQELFSRGTTRQKREEFILEMRHLAKLRHPCITTVMGAVVSCSGDPMLVMEYMVCRYCCSVFVHGVESLTFSRDLGVWFALRRTSRRLLASSGG